MRRTEPTAPHRSEPSRRRRTVSTGGKNFERRQSPGMSESTLLWRILVAFFESPDKHCELDAGED